jgi:hypothetical protein
MDKLKAMVVRRSAYSRFDWWRFEGFLIRENARKTPKISNPFGRCRQFAKN